MGIIAQRIADGFHYQNSQGIKQIQRGYQIALLLLIWQEKMEHAYLLCMEE